MATYVKKTVVSKQTRSSVASKPEQTRKPVSIDPVSNNSSTESSKNSSVVANLGKSLTGMSVVAKAVAEVVRDQMREPEAAPVPAVSPPRGPLPFASERDVMIRQKDLAEKVASVIEKAEVRLPSEVISKTAIALVQSSRDVAAPAREKRDPPPLNRAVPEIEEVRVELGKGRGAVDNFYVTLLFNLPDSMVNSVRSFRLFRAIVESPKFTRPLTTLSPAGISRLSSFRGRKNGDASQPQVEMELNGVPNSVSKLNYFDPLTRLRVSADDVGELQVPPPMRGQKISPDAQYSDLPPALAHLDKSVARDLNVIANVQKNPVYGFSVGTGDEGIRAGSSLNIGTRLGEKHHVDVASSTRSAEVVDDSALSFSEVGHASLMSLAPRRVGDTWEFELIDGAVSYGRAYSYFIVSVDKDALQSARSQIVTATVEGVRVPERPASVVAQIDQERVTLSITTEDQLVEKFEVHRLEDSVDRATSAVSLTIADSDGFVVSKKSRDMSQNKFLLIGECLNGVKVGAQLTDKTTLPGRHYTYRVYSVDVFGNKSESPFELEAYVPDLEQRFVDLHAPSILAEVDERSQKMRVTFRCDDENVQIIKIERRDLTIGQDIFSVPSSPARVVLGPGRIAKGRLALSGERIYDTEREIAWNGVFGPEHGKDQTFVDPTSMIDHIYQYRVWGEDRYGNRSSFSLTRPTMLVRKPVVNSPVGLRAAFDPVNAGVAVSWSAGNIDKQADELIGNQTDLSESFVRTLYQLQRLKVGEEGWQNFPLMTGSSFFDPLVNKELGARPGFRPPYLDESQEYLYRVQAIQTGSFVSNFSSPVRVYTGVDVATPTNLSLKTPDFRQRPFYVAINWDTHEGSGVVDSWEIERAEVNNLAASKLNASDPSTFSDVKFEKFRTVYRESSRFSSKVADERDSSGSSTLTGEHYYVDQQVDFGNSYFYRVRAVSRDGSTSAWAYKGVRLTSDIFERKWISTLSDNERRELTSEMRPLVMGKGSRKQPKSSVSLQPEYSKPSSSRTSPRLKKEFASE